MGTTTQYKTVHAAPTNRVRILTSQKELDPNTYEVKEYDRQLAILLNLNTQKEIKVHKSRIVQNLDINVQENNKVDSNTATTKTAAKTKKSATKKAKYKFNVKDFAGALGSGCEHFVKKTTFDHDNIDTRAHVLILPDHRSFVTFNTYDGSLGRKFQEAQSSITKEIFHRISKRKDVEIAYPHTEVLYRKK